MDLGAQHADIVVGRRWGIREKERRTTVFITKTTTNLSTQIFKIKQHKRVIIKVDTSLRRAKGATDTIFNKVSYAGAILKNPWIPKNTQLKTAQTQREFKMKTPYPARTQRTIKWKRPNHARIRKSAKTKTH